MLDDLSKTIKAQLYERANSPLLASFVFSWIGWNYRFVMTVISSMSLTEKLSFIDTEIFTGWVWFFQGMLGPICTTILWIFLYPKPAKFVYEYSIKQQQELKALKQKVYNDTLLSLAESRKIREEMDKASSEFDQRTQKTCVEIEKLNDDIKRLKDENNLQASLKSEAEIQRGKQQDRIKELEAQIHAYYDNEESTKNPQTPSWQG